MNKTGKIISAIVYGTGAAIVLVLLMPIALQSHIILFPEAMLPMELRELASVWLAGGFVPMLVSSIFFYKAHGIAGSRHRKRNTVLIYIPAAVCLVCIVFWTCVLGIGMVTMHNK